MKLTKEEQTILDSVEAEEWNSVPKLREELVEYQTAAQAAQRKDKRVNIRMTDSGTPHLGKHCLSRKQNSTQG